MTNDFKPPDKPVEMMKEFELMGFGKHSHEKLGDVPASYLLWCWEQKGMMQDRPRLRAYIERNLVHLEKEAKRGNNY